MVVTLQQEHKSSPVSQWVSSPSSRLASLEQHHAKTFHTGGIAQKQLVGVASIVSVMTCANCTRTSPAVSFRWTRTVKRVHRLPATVSASRLSVTSSRCLKTKSAVLLRVVELFEARKPKGQAIVTEYSGVVAAIEIKGLRKVVIHADQIVKEETSSGLLGETIAEDVTVNNEEVIPAGTEINEKFARRLRDAGLPTVKLRREHLVPYRGQLQIQEGQIVEPGHRLTEGPLDPQKVLELQGVRGIQQYIVREIQRVYKSQGVDINDKHVEVITRQMLKKRKIKNIGDTHFLPGQVVDKFEFEDENNRVRELDPPGSETTADWVLLGITEASLATDSFLAAASFQATRVLTEAAVRGKKDNLVGGLKEERHHRAPLSLAGTGLPQYRNLQVKLEGLDEAYHPNGGGGTAVLERPAADWSDTSALAALVNGTNGTGEDHVIDPDGDDKI